MRALIILFSILIFVSVSWAADMQFPTYLSTRGSATTPLGTTELLPILQSGSVKMVRPTALEGVVNGGTCSGSYNINAANGGTILLSLDGACSIGITSLQAGQSFALFLTQSATTAPTFSSAFKWAGGVAPTWSASATKYDTVSCASPDGVKLICGALIDAR